MKTKELLKIPIESAKLEWTELALRAEGIKCFISARVIGDEDKKILLMHLYSQEKLRNGNTQADYRMFINKDDYITQDLQCKETKWREACLANLIGWWNLEKRCMLADKPSWDAVCCFLQCEGEPLKALDGYQKEIMKKRLCKKHKKIIEKIDTAMEPIPQLPEDFINWMRETAMYDSRYFIYTYKPGKKQTGTCTWCGEAVSIEDARHNRQAVCPYCGSKVTCLAAGRMSKYRTDEKWCAVLQPYPDGFVIRYFEIRREFRDHPTKPTDTWREYLRDIYTGEQMIRYEWSNFRQTSEIRWCDNTRCFKTYNTAVYSKNLDTVLANTPWKYSALRQMAEAKPGFCFNLYDYLAKYLSYPFIEYFVKARLYRLTSQFINNEYSTPIRKDGKNLKEILGVDKQMLSILQEIDAGEDELELFAQAKALRLKISPQQVAYIAKNFDVEGETLEELTECSSLHKTLKYLRKGVKSERGMENHFRDWQDYIRNCKKLGYDVTNEFIAFPKNFKEAHDHAADLVKEKQEQEAAQKQAVIRQKIASMYEGLQEQYGWSNKKFCIAAPRSADEIITEGQTLHHCVGTYLERVAEGESIILFLRQNENPDTPFYTIEVRGFNIAQCRGKYNAPMTPTVKTITERYQQEVLDKLKIASQKGDTLCVIGLRKPALAV